MSAEDLPILGTEPLPVELANTLYGTLDFLGTRLQARQWCAAVRLPPVGDIAGLRILRDGIHQLFSAAISAAEPPESAVSAVNEAAAAAPAFSRLRWQPHASFTAERQPAAQGDAAVLGGLATEAISLLTDRRAALLRRCEGPECCLLFVQQHGRRRFCNDGCAHRDRQARYYRRRTSASGR